MKAAMENNDAGSNSAGVEVIIKVEVLENGW